MANSARGIVTSRPGPAGTRERFRCPPAGWHAADRAEPEIPVQRQLDLRAVRSQYVICAGSGKRGYVKYGCHAHKQSGMCDNKLTIRQDRLEEQFLAAIERRLLDPVTLEYAVKRCEQELRNRLAEMEKRLCARIRETANWRALERFAFLGFPATESRAGGATWYGALPRGAFSADDEHWHRQDGLGNSWWP